VKYLCRVAAEHEACMQQVYDCSLRQEVTIQIPESERDYLQRTGSLVPDWSGGVTLPVQRMIVLRPGAYFDPRLYAETLRHELTHMYLADKLDTFQVPRWFNEGLAMLLSGKTFSWDDHLITGNAVVMDKLLDLDEIDAMLVFGLGKAQLAYVQSLLAVHFLVHEHGEHILPALIVARAGGENWEQILQHYTGSDSGQLNERLREFIQEKYRWAFLLQMGNLFWLAVALLFIAGFTAIKIRNRRILREWDKNEEN